MDSAPQVNEPGILLFDGVCNLCNFFVNFIINHDHKRTIKFSSLQSDVGREALTKNHLNPDYLESLVLLKNDKTYIKSRAALEVLRSLGIPWRFFYIFIIFPRPFTDWVYNWVAKNRYRWFGKREVCRMPTPDLESRFLRSSDLG